VRTAFLKLTQPSGLNLPPNPDRGTLANPKKIFYKVLWLILVAYPLWSKGTLAGSPEDTTSAFLWVILPIVAVPWGYVFVNYIYKPKN
jgi:hypothetical protein